METRTLPLQAELRSVGDANSRLLRGVAVVYGQLAEIRAKAGTFYERILPGALTRTLNSGREIKARFEHRDLLASTGNGTLRLSDGPEGLAVEMDVAETRAGDDALALVRRGDVRGMSFGFYVAPKGQRFHRSSGKLIRDVSDVDLEEVTVTDNPVYLETSIALRSVDPSALAEAEAALSQPSRTQRIRRLRRLQAV